MGQIGRGAYMFKKNQKWCYRKKAARLLAVFFISSTIATSALGSISHAASKGAADTGTTQNHANVIKSRRSTQKTDPITLSHRKDTILTDTVNTLSVNNMAKKWTAYFESSDESILKITKSTSSSCEYRGVRPGTAEIRVKVSKPGFLFVPNNVNVYLHCDVTVSPKAVSIKFTKKKYKLNIGTKKKLKLTTRPSISKEKATFESSDTEIVEIDTNGRIYAKSIGTVTITAKISNGKTAKCKVIVRNKTAQ